MLHSIHRKQLLKSNVKTIWDFISSPQNLQLITPAHLQLRPLYPEQLSKMAEGQIIEYLVRPVMSIPFHWVTQITHVKENEFFIDEQRKGPYKMWIHRHSIKPIEQGVEMIDQVYYQLPLGLIGKITNSLYVKKQLESVFDYRYQKLNEIFNI